MSKKQNNKKKLSVKLSIGDTAIVIDYETAMHIAETYDYLANENENEHAESFRRVADTVRMQAIENYFDSTDDDYEEW
jgi:hypothetical protein